MNTIQELKDHFADKQAGISFEDVDHEAPVSYQVAQITRNENQRGRQEAYAMASRDWRDRGLNFEQELTRLAVVFGRELSNLPYKLQNADDQERAFWGGFADAVNDVLFYIGFTSEQQTKDGE